MGLPPVWCTTYIISLDQCYTRSNRSITSPATIRRHLLHIGHRLDLQCHLLQLICSPFEVEVEGELIGEVVVEMGREVVVHLSRHCLLPYPLILTHHRILPYFPILTHHPILLYPHKLTHHLSYPRHLHIFTISSVTKASLHSSRYHLIIPPFIILYIASHR